MINVELNFPLLGLKNNDPNIYVFKDHIGIVSKGGAAFYKDLWIVDINGDSFQLEQAKLKGKAGIKYTIRYFQQMYEVELNFKFLENIALDELKSRLSLHIYKYKNHWLALGPIDLINEKMRQYTQYTELILMFR